MLNQKCTLGGSWQQIHGNPMPLDKLLIKFYASEFLCKQEQNRTEREEFWHLKRGIFLNKRTPKF